MYGQIRKFYMIGDLRSHNGQYFVIEQGTLDDYSLFAQLAFCSSRDRNGLLSELSVLWNAPILVAQSSVNTPVLQSLDKLSGQWGSSELKRSRSLADDGQTGSYVSGRLFSNAVQKSASEKCDAAEFRLRLDLFEARFWIVSELPTRTKPLVRRTLRVGGTRRLRAP